MTAPISLSAFHQWLLAESAGTTSAQAIVLHIPESRPCELLIQEISDYLNEYDDADGRWLPATPELVAKIARDSNHRRLLGLPDGAEADAPGSQPDPASTLTALGQRGHIIFRSPGLGDEELGLVNTFHAGVGGTGEITEDCHLILNPVLMDRKCIAHIIGDVFLEWLHCEARRNPAIRDIR